MMTNAGQSLCSGGGWQERLRHGRKQENWTYAIDLGKVLDRLNLELFEQ
jgi:hypothetical protein